MLRPYSRTADLPNTGCIEQQTLDASNNEATFCSRCFSSNTASQLVIGDVGSRHRRIDGWLSTQAPTIISLLSNNIPADFEPKFFDDFTISAIGASVPDDDEDCVVRPLPLLVIALQCR